MATEIYDYGDVTDTPIGPSQSESLASGPLGSLFTSKYRYDRLQYPADLGSTRKGHLVIFDVYDAHSTSIEDVSKWVTETYNKVEAAATKENVAAVADGLKQTYNQGVELFNSKSLGEFGTKVSSGLSSLTGAKQTAADFLQTKKDFVKSVYLYMPDSLDFTYAANWDKTDLMKAAGSVPLVGGIARGVTSFMENDAVKLAMSKFGYAFNPQSQMLFEGIDFRTYTMSFVFTPRSSREANVVKEIIKTFRMYAAPTIITEAAGFFFKPPGIFAVRFESDGQPNYNINQLTDSVLESVEVNYAPNGWSAHEGGMPVQTTMNLQFKEMVLVDRAKISQGY